MKQDILLLFILLCSGLLVQGKFPKGFSFGASTAAYQIEGAWLADGKSMSEWDNWAHAGFIGDNSTSDIVGNSYYLYPEDISLMKQYGIKHYRMSVSWPRIVPYGTVGSPVNMKGIEHYRKQFQDLINAGITPYVTIFHGDLPSNLDIIGNGMLDPDFIDEYLYFAEACFKHFGDIVKYWFTFNEPWCTAALADNLPEEASTLPYTLGHILLLAHSATVDLYRTKYKPTQNGKIGWVLNAEYFYPKNASNPADVEAAKRGLLFQIDWFSEPLFTGDYPKGMREILGDRLPKFTEEQSRKLKGSQDFYAINNYFSYLAEPATSSNSLKKVGDYWSDRNVNTSFDPSWNKTATDWPIVPEGIHDLLVHVNEKWVKGSGLEIYITENGAAIKENSVHDVLYDQIRIDYLQRYISQIAQAIDEGVNITKYFVWSLLDNFEWGAGVQMRFGIIRIEYGDNPVRVPKASMKWYSELIKTNS